MGGRFPTWLRYGFPSVCFCLGTWQIYRLNWKNALIAELEKGLSRSSVKLDAIPDDVESIRYRRLRLYGDPELTAVPFFVGPRGARDIGVDYAMHFIIPFRLCDGTRVLVDYGRVPLGREAAIQIPLDQNYIEAMLERPERKSIAVGANNPKVGRWLYKDVTAMAQKCGTVPLLFRRITRKMEPEEIPIAAPPRIDIPNRHLEYVVTWYAIAAFTYAFGFLRR